MHYSVTQLLSLAVAFALSSPVSIFMVISIPLWVIWAVMRKPRITFPSRKMLLMLLPFSAIPAILTLAYYYQARHLRTWEQLGAPCQSPASVSALCLFILSILIDVLIIRYLKGERLLAVLLSLIQVSLAFGAWTAAVFSIEGLYM